jgi:hypothetical protein
MTKKTSASKNDRRDKKPDYSLIPRVFMDQLSYCMEAGAIKYGRHNYTQGHELLQLTAAATRHIKLIEEGEDIDKDTSERVGVDVHHWACIAANALMALHQLKLGTLKDNRHCKLYAPDKTYTRGHIEQHDDKIKYYNDLGQQITDAEFKSINHLTIQSECDTVNNTGNEDAREMLEYIYKD